MKHPKFTHSFEVDSTLPEPLHALRRLALNLRWTWDAPTQSLFREIDPELWDSVQHNPVGLLRVLPVERLEALADDRKVLGALAACEASLDSYLGSETWFDREFPGARDHTLIAYFCAEFGLTEAIPAYSGGLGVLAGDHLKSASDLGLPLVGVGLLYGRGYFRQELTPDGWQLERYPLVDPYRLPLQVVRGRDARPVCVEVETGNGDRPVLCQLWVAEVGRVRLYLLDSNVLENEPVDQGITDTLYGGDQEMRLRQELILGVGGMRALRAVGVVPTVCHMNEGHSALLSLERIRQVIEDYGCDLPTAQKLVSSSNVFTTHTPVSAGFDWFPRAMVERHVNPVLAKNGLKLVDFEAVARVEQTQTGEFSMAHFAIGNAARVNAVSRLHAEVSRAMFSSRWPGFSESEAPIAGISNGMHAQTWVGGPMADLFDAHLGAAWRALPADPASWEKVDKVPDDELWQARLRQKAALIDFVRKKLSARSAPGEPCERLDPAVLTLGFARRFATYKRATLLLSDRERFRRLLADEQRPVQIVFAGKSHPRDDEGKRLIQEIVQFIESEGLGSRAVFLEDYDIEIARMLVQGVDVWLNTPRRPLEASGTSGMKAVPNGVLNCSILDGWWDEAYEPGLGWAIGRRDVCADQGYQDWLDSLSLYRTLEASVVQLYYAGAPEDLPSEWLGMIKRSIRSLAPRYAMDRVLAEYWRRSYRPAAASWSGLAGDGLKRAREAATWTGRVRSLWPEVRVLSVSDNACVSNPPGFELVIRVNVELGALSPEDVRVEALLGRAAPSRELEDSSAVELKLDDTDANNRTFIGKVLCDEPGRGGYVVRVVPRHPDVNVPTELELVAWEPSR